MAAIFQIESNIVKPYAETLLLEPFKTIWRKDKDRNKRMALRKFAYIEFITSQRKSNPFRQYPEELKHSKIMEHIVKDDKDQFKICDLITHGIEVCINFQKEASTTYQYYMAAKLAAEKMIHFFTHFNIGERNKAGIPIYKPRDITSAINDTSKTLNTLKELEKRVEEELFESSKKKAGKSISVFAM